MTVSHKREFLICLTRNRVKRLVDGSADAFTRFFGKRTEAKFDVHRPRLAKSSILCLENFCLR